MRTNLIPRVWGIITLKKKRQQQQKSTWKYKDYEILTVGIFCLQFLIPLLWCYPKGQFYPTIPLLLTHVPHHFILGSKMPWRLPFLDCKSEEVKREGISSLEGDFSPKKFILVKANFSDLFWTAQKWYSMSSTS